jgi:SNF2 family DNA or RNA helicase
MIKKTSLPACSRTSAFKKVASASVLSASKCELPAPSIPVQLRSADRVQLIRSLDAANSASAESQNCLDCEKQLEQQARRRSGSNPDLPAMSTKIRTILDLLREIEARGEGDEKTIIFSQFTSMLDLLQPFLKDSGIRHVRCELPARIHNIFVSKNHQCYTDDGSMSKPERDAALEKIRSSEKTKVILISFKAGSTGT